MLTKIAVLTDGGIHLSDGTRRAWTHTIRHVSDIARPAIASDVRAVWLHPESLAAVRAAQPSFWHDRAGWRLWATGPQGKPPTVARIHEDAPGRHDLEPFIYADFAGQWAGGVRSPADMLAALAAFEGAMGHHATWSPSRTALDGLEAYNASETRRAWLAPLSEAAYYDTPWPGHRAPSHVNQQITVRKFAHVFDTNGAYLAAAAGLDFGTGDPDHVPGEQYDAKAAGLWRVTARPGPGTDPGWPSPWLMGQRRNINQEWYYDPQINIARRMGWQITVQEGYVWREKHRMMHEWADHMWHAREDARAAMPPAVAMIKQAYTQAFGLMKYQPVERRTPGRWQRPDHAGRIVAEAYARHMAKIVKLTELYGPCYFAISADAICLMSDEADPWLAFPYLADRRGRIGASKHVYSIGGPGDLIIAAAQGKHAPDIMKMIGAMAHA